MKALIITDGDDVSAPKQQIMLQLRTWFEAKGFSVGTIATTKDLKPCMGCFSCWLKTPGQCVMKDGIADINRAVMNCDTLVWVSPVVFGQLSANVKNAMDRWLPNMLPFFHTRIDGSTMHPPRYEWYPKQLIIGTGDGISDDDKQLFHDITKKHRTGVETIVGDADTNIVPLLNNITFEKTGGPL